MTQMTSSADKVALVADRADAAGDADLDAGRRHRDMHDRRIVALVALAIALLRHHPDHIGVAQSGDTQSAAGALLCGRQRHGAVRPAWQSSVSEQVPTETLPAASR